MKLTLEIFLNFIIFAGLWLIVGTHSSLNKTLAVFIIVVISTVLLKRYDLDKKYGKPFYGFLVFDLFFLVLTLIQVFGTPD